MCLYVSVCETTDYIKSPTDNGWAKTNKALYESTMMQG